MVTNPQDRSPIGVGRIVGGSFTVYGHTWRQHLIVAAVLQAPVLLPTLVLISLLLEATVVVLQTRTIDAVVQAAILAGAQLGLAFVSAFLFVLLGGAACQLVAAWAGGQHITIVAACRHALRRFWRLAGALLAAFAVIAGALLAVGVFLVLIYVGFLVIFQVDVASDPRVFWVALWLTGLAALVAGYVLLDAMVRWAVFVQVVMLEEVTPLDALKRSAALVRGNWLRTAATMGLLLVLPTVITMVIATALNVAFALVGGLYSPQVSNGVAIGIAQVVVTPIPAIGVTLLYYELVEGASFWQRGHPHAPPP